MSFQTANRSCDVAWGVTFAGWAVLALGSQVGAFALWAIALFAWCWTWIEIDHINDRTW